MPEIVDIRDHWARVRPALQELILETEEDLIPEDVYHSCKSGDSVLVLADEGFVILCINTDQFTSKRELHVWFAYAFEPGGDCVSKYMDYFKGLAVQGECGYIVTKTSYDRIGEHLLARGWAKGLTEYRYEVT